MSYWADLANRAALWASIAIAAGIALIVVEAFILEPTILLSSGA